VPAGTRREVEASPLSTLVVVAVWIAVAAYAAFWVPRRLPARARDFDFGVYYAEALALAQHDNPYTVDLKPIAASFGFDIRPVDHATDPPPYLLMIEPLAATGPARAFWIWTAANAAMLALALWLIFGIDAAGPRSAALLAAVAIAYPPVRALFFFGQSKMSILLALAAAMRALQRRRDASAGLLLAFASLTRIFPLLMAIFLILRRRWRALRYMVAGIALGVMVTVAVLGLSATIDWIAGIKILTLTMFLDAGENVALRAFVSRLVWAVFGVQASGGSEIARQAAVMLSVAAAFLLTCVPTLHAPIGNREADLRLFGLWVVAAVMLSPIASIYDMILLLIPLSQIAQQAFTARTFRAATSLAVASVALMFLVCGSGCLNSVGWIVSYVLVRRIGLPIGALIAEGATLSLFLTYAAAYCSALEPAAYSGKPL
jgi:hypothetical protein